MRIFSPLWCHHHSRWQFHSSKSYVKCQRPTCSFFFSLISRTICKWRSNTVYNRTPFPNFCAHIVQTLKAFSFWVLKAVFNLYCVMKAYQLKINTWNHFQVSTCGAHVYKQLSFHCINLRLGYIAFVYLGMQHVRVVLSYSHLCPSDFCLGQVLIWCGLLIPFRLLLVWVGLGSL